MKCHIKLNREWEMSMKQDYGYLKNYGLGEKKMQCLEFW